MKSELFVNTETGIATRVFPSGEIRVITGMNNHGYIWVRIEKRLKLIHRLVWEQAHGPIPSGVEVDHINGVRTDNRLMNLRLVSKSQNMQNQHRARVDNHSGVKGVRWDDGVRKWRARITVNGARFWLGQFDSIDDARTAYRNAAAIFHSHNPHARSTS